MTTQACFVPTGVSFSGIEPFAFLRHELGATLSDVSRDHLGTVSVIVTPVGGLVRHRSDAALQCVRVAFARVVDLIMVSLDHGRMCSSELLFLANAVGGAWVLEHRLCARGLHLFVRVAQARLALRLRRICLMEIIAFLLLPAGVPAVGIPQLLLDRDVHAAHLVCAVHLHGRADVFAWAVTIRAT